MEVVGDAGVIRISGDVDYLSAPELQAVADKLLDDGARSLVFDCSAVDFVDSGGLRVFVEAHQRADEWGGTVTVRRPRPLVVRVMQITALDSILQIDRVPEADRASS
jgi:anti-anti-sigma factor